MGLLSGSLMAALLLTAQAEVPAAPSPTPEPAPAPAIDHLSAVENAVFGICPEVISGALDLASEESATKLGYRLAASHAQRTNIETGHGKNAIVIWGPAPQNVESTHSCIVTFAAPGTTADFDEIARRVRARGYGGGEPTLASAKSRQLKLAAASDARATFYMIEVYGGADYITYDKAIMIVMLRKED